MTNMLKKIGKLFRTDAARPSVCDLLIFDDIYPHPASGFRLEEFTILLEQTPGSRILLSGAAYSFLKLPPRQHEDHIRQLLGSHPSLAGRLEKITGAFHIHCRLFYCVFLNNMIRNLEWVELNEVPFVFTLYPGGGFMPGTAATEESLRKIFASRNFRKVIVTQQKTYDYLLKGGLCREENILFVFGVVVPQISMEDDRILKIAYGKDKRTLDICFCAAKYSKYGEDKGYPLFVDFMKAIAPKYPFVQFHVIGGFDKDVLSVEEIGDRVRFHGYQDYNRLKLLFLEMDLILSPNQPDKLDKGAFDGFPLGTVIEAALNEVAVMLTDPFGENIYFEDGEELIIIQPDLQDMLDKFEMLLGQEGKLRDIAVKGRLKFKQIYSSDFQMRPRLGLFQSLLSGDGKPQFTN